MLTPIYTHRFSSWGASSNYPI